MHWTCEGFHLHRERLFSSAAVDLLFLGPTQSQSPSVLTAPQGEKGMTWLSFVIIVAPFLLFPFGSDSPLIFDKFISFFP